MRTTPHASCFDVDDDDITPLVSPMRALRPRKRVTLSPVKTRRRSQAPAKTSARISLPHAPTPWTSTSTTYPNDGPTSTSASSLNTLTPSTPRMARRQTRASTAAAAAALAALNEQPAEANEPAIPTPEPEPCAPNHAEDVDDEQPAPGQDGQYAASAASSTSLSPSPSALNAPPTPTPAPHIIPSPATAADALNIPGASPHREAPISIPSLLSSYTATPPMSPHETDPIHHSWIGLIVGDDPSNPFVVAVSPCEPDLSRAGEL